MAKVKPDPQQDDMWKECDWTLHTLDSQITSKARYAFASGLIHQAHQDPVIKNLLGLDKETQDQTQERVLGRFKKYK